MISAIPDANQTFRQITYDVISKRVENDVRPQVFFTNFPDRVLYARDVAARRRRLEGRPGRATPAKPDATVLLHGAARTADPGPRRNRRSTSSSRTAPATRAAAPDGKEIDTYRFPNDLIVKLDPKTVFPRFEIMRGINEMTIAELRRAGRRQAPQPASPAHQEMDGHPAEVLVPGGLPRLRDHRRRAGPERRPRRQARRLRRRHRGDLRLLHPALPGRGADQGATTPAPPGADRPLLAGAALALVAEPPAAALRHRGADLARPVGGRAPAVPQRGQADAARASAWLDRRRRARRPAPTAPCRGAAGAAAPARRRRRPHPAPVVAAAQHPRSLHQPRSTCGRRRSRSRRCSASSTSAPSSTSPTSCSRDRRRPARCCSCSAS